MVPNRLSYKEMYSDAFRYPSEWTESWDSYITHKDELMAVIKNYIENHDNLIPKIQQQAASLHSYFFSAGALLENIK